MIWLRWSSSIVFTKLRSFMNLHYDLRFMFVPPVLLLNISQWTNFSVFSNVMDGTNWGFSVLVIYVFLLLITCSSKERMEEVQDKKKECFGQTRSILKAAWKPGLSKALKHAFELLRGRVRDILGKGNKLNKGWIRYGQNI